MDLSVIIPCYFEAEILEAHAARLFETLQTMPLKSEVLFVDDGSTDGTREILARLEAAGLDLPAVRVLLHERNQGRGGAVMTGVGAAAGRFAGFLDIDLEVDCIYLPEVVERLEQGADLVVGDRFYDLRDVRPHRVVLSRGYRRLARGLLGHPVRDSECGFKFFRSASMRPVLEATTERGWFWDTEVVYRAWQAGLRIEEVPMRFVRNPHKTSTVKPLRDSLDYLYRLARFRARVELERRGRR